MLACARQQATRQEVENATLVRGWMREQLLPCFPDMGVVVASRRRSYSPMAQFAVDSPHRSGRLASRWLIHRTAIPRFTAQSDPMRKRLLRKPRHNQRIAYGAAAGGVVALLPCTSWPHSRTSPAGMDRWGQRCIWVGPVDWQLEFDAGAHPVRAQMQGCRPRCCRCCCCSVFTAWRANGHPVAAREPQRFQWNAAGASALTLMVALAASLAVDADGVCLRAMAGMYYR